MGSPALFDPSTVMVACEVPDVSGVPVISPVLELRAKPGGKPTAEKVSDPPPAYSRLWDVASPTLP